MSAIKKKLIKDALRQYKRIYPCIPYTDFEECFIVEQNKVLFWFNTEDESTHVLCAELA